VSQRAVSTGSPDVGQNATVGKVAPRWAGATSGLVDTKGDVWRESGDQEACWATRSSSGVGCRACTKVRFLGLSSSLSVRWHASYVAETGAG